MLITLEDIERSDRYFFHHDMLSEAQWLLKKQITNLKETLSVVVCNFV